MKKILFLSICVFLISHQQAASETISCESFTLAIQWDIAGTVKTCTMRSTTTINSEGVSISPVDSSVLGIEFGQNKKVSFLPIRVAEAFPNLIAYAAYMCSLRTISKINFKNLKSLRELGLSHNQIERINSDTFDDLTAIEFIALNNNNIKQLNGAVFAGLTKLTDIRLKENICINRDFSDTARATTTEVSENCGFADLETISSQIESLSGKVFKENRELSLQVANLKAQLVTSEGLKQQSDVTVRYLSNEVTRMAAEIASIKAALSSTAERKVPRTK